MNQNNFMTSCTASTACYQKEGCMLFFKYDKEANSNHESSYLSFYLSDMITRNKEFDVINAYNNVFKITKSAVDEYTIISENVFSSDLPPTGKGSITKIDQGLEIVYKEAYNGKIIQDLHYQYLIEPLDDTKNLLKIINCKDKKTEKFFIADSDFTIEQINHQSKKIKILN